MTGNISTAPPLFVLRSGISEDALAIIEVHRSAVRELAAEFYSREIIDAWAPSDTLSERAEGLARRIESGEELVVVAEDQSGRIVGFGSIALEEAELRAVYVAAEHGRKGVGRLILHRLETLARNAGLTELHMDASINAEAFYVANGFVSEGRGEHILRSGVRMACVRMRKPL